MSEDEEYWGALNSLNRRIYGMQRQKAKLVIDHAPAELRKLAMTWLEQIEKITVEDWIGFGDEQAWRSLSEMRDAYLSNLEILRRDEP